MAFQADHGERGGSLERSVEVDVTRQGYVFRTYRRTDADRGSIVSATGRSCVPGVGQHCLA